MPYQFVREPLRDEEADALPHACQTTEEKLIIWTLLDTGLRVFELCSLTPANMLWQQKAFRIEGKGGMYGKQSKKRVVPMSRRIRPLMEHYFALHDTWFVGARQAQKIVKRIANRAQITQEVTPHVLRHTFATLAIQKGISLAAIQKILGHDRLTTGKRGRIYFLTHFLCDALAAEPARIGVEVTHDRVRVAVPVWGYPISGISLLARRTVRMYEAPETAVTGAIAFINNPDRAEREGRKPDIGPISLLPSRCRKLQLQGFL